jgi:D-serine dehydratase
MPIIRCSSTCRAASAAAGGVAFGLKLAFGDNVHCFFAEPHSPCMLLGVYTGLHDEIAVQDLGIDNVTAPTAGGRRASGFVGRAMERLLDGFYTLSDQSMYDMLGWLAQEEGIRLEPSALAGMAGPVRVHSAYQRYPPGVGDRRRHGAGRRDGEVSGERPLIMPGGGCALPGLQLQNLLNMGNRKQQRQRKHSERDQELIPHRLRLHKIILRHVHQVTAAGIAP